MRRGDMKSPREIIMEKKSAAIIKALAKRNIDGVYAPTRKEACKEILRIIPDKSLVGLGGSMTLMETGLVDALRKRDIELLDRNKKDIGPAEIDEMRRRGVQSDI